MPADRQEPELKPATGNPWYVLMTLFGPSKEQKNRTFWNGWAFPGLSTKVREKAAEVTGEKLRDLSEGERDELLNRFRTHFGSTAQLPDPTEVIELSGIEVDKRFFFNKLIFPGDVRLNWSVFKEDFVILNSFFARNLICQHSTFTKAATISNSRVRGTASFREASVHGSSAFQHNVYRKSVSFRDSSFGKDANFLKSEYTQACSFRNVEFQGAAIFDKSRFHDMTTFRRCQFSGQALFKDCQFEGKADFSETQYDSITSYADSAFAKHPPALFGARLHEDTDWARVKWPPDPKKADEASDHRRCYERLKQLMGGLSMYQDEQRFIRYALRCREIEDPRSLASWASRTFRLVSDYGWSISRPLYWLLASIAVGWGATWGIENAMQPSDAVNVITAGQALGISFSNTFSFLGLANTFLEQETKSLSHWSEIVAGFQMFLGLILLFLLGLGLRNRFRIR